MAPGPEDSTQPQGGVLVRLLQLPMISATRQVLQETYSSTKQTHPIICTVCGVYERGARKAGSLAVWTIQPAMHRLEPHISAVDVLACKGLDRLEEKIPALQYPPDKLAAGIAEMVTSTVQSAREGISRPFTSTSDKALGVASSGYQLTWSAVSGGVDYVLNSAPVRLAGEGADAALTLTEHLVSYILPASAEEMEKDTSWQQESDTSGDAVQPSYKRLGSLFAVVCQRAYDRTAWGIQHTGAWGRDLALSIPGVSPLAGFTWRNLEKAGGLALGLQSSVVGLVTGTVKRKKEGEVLKLQNTCVTAVVGVKSTLSVTFDMAKEGVVTLQEALGVVRKHAPLSVPQYSLSFWGDVLVASSYGNMSSILHGPGLHGPSAEEGAEAVPPSKDSIPRGQVSNGSAQEQKNEAGGPGSEEGPARPSETTWQSHQQKAPESKGSQGGRLSASMSPQHEPGRVEGTRSPGSSQVRMPPPTSHAVAKKE